MWQKCPICNGEGEVQNYGTVTSLFSICPTCNGKRIISEINGLPPNNHIDNSFEQAKEMEKEQIINAFNDGDFMSTGCEDDAVKYYNETYNK